MQSETSSSVGGVAVGARPRGGGRETRQAAADPARPDLVLAEAQHRFANMFQLLASLVRRRQRRLTDAAAREQLEWVHDLTVMLGLLNRRLVAADQASLADLLAEQATLWRSVCADQGVELEVDLEEAEIPACTAMPLALAVHELVTNCVEHAFEGRDGGTVRIALRRSGDGTQAELRVHDNGVGLPAGTTTARSGNDGLGLVARLAAQVGGSFAVTGGEGGTDALLRFPVASRRS